VPDLRGYRDSAKPPSSPDNAVDTWEEFGHVCLLPSSAARSAPDVGGATICSSTRRRPGMFPAATRNVSLSSLGWSSENQRCTTRSRSMVSAEYPPLPFSQFGEELVADRAVIGIDGWSPARSSSWPGRHQVRPADDAHELAVAKRPAGA
jgi:hypothetical protein